MAKKPNIVYIFSDQHRGDTMGCAGNPAAITPNMDRLAAEGVNFEQCCTNSPLCMPARASMMSGQYVSEHGVWRNSLGTDPKGPSHVRNIRDAGYRTALVGKTHLYQAERGKIHTKHYIPVMEDWGFTDPHEINGLVVSIFGDSHYTDFLEKRGLLDDHRRFMVDYCIPWLGGKNKPWEDPPNPLPIDAMMDSYIGNTAADWIRNYDGEDPFYMQVLFMGPHDPFDAPDQFRDLYQSVDIPDAIMESPGEPIPDYTKRVQAIRAPLDGMTKEEMKRMRQLYYAKVSQIDHCIGSVIKALEEKGMMGDTWIVYNSDHGDNLADHFLTQKVVFYESALKIPLIIRPPGGISGWKSTALCDHLDVAASLIGMADGKSLEKSGGRSLVPQILAGEDSPRANEGKEVIFSEVVGYSMVFDGRYKLTVEAESQKPVEMFDLQEDPKELTNCVNHPKYEEVRQQLLENHLSKLHQRLDISALKDPKRTRDPIQGGNLLKMIEALKKEKYS